MKRLTKVTLAVLALALCTPTVVSAKKSKDAAPAEKVLVDKAGMSEYVMPGDVPEAKIVSKNFSALFDGVTKAKDAEGKAIPDFTAAKIKAGQTITFDLGKKHKLTGFSIWASQQLGLKNGCVKTVAVYLTDSKDPSKDAKLNGVKGELPDLSNWTCAVEKATLALPTVAKYDYDGNGTIDKNDNKKAMAQGFYFEFENASKLPAARYVRVQFLENFAGNNAVFRTPEISFWGVPAKK